MKKVNITIFGKNKKAIIAACEYALNQLKLGTTSENIGFENRSHVFIDTEKSNDKEFCEWTNADPEE